jgi:hypothetical protein
MAVSEKTLATRFAEKIFRKNHLKIKLQSFN